MAYALGWKDILRPIRDGYRHLFPTPDTGPTPEERRKRREEDRLKGFTYFDTFEQLESWTVHDTDPLQRSNTPLLRRCVDDDDCKHKARVLLCHDYAGNYHDYESVDEPDANEQIYACEYLQHVESFVYFSHKLVCVPPPTWTNTLHRNGVKAVGTIILEPQVKDTERLLQYTGAGANMNFTLAHVLAGIADHHGFDGYLVNIEKPFPKDTWISYLEAFLVQLRQELGGEKQLVWYDALTKSNRISYQNALTPYNLPFAEACGSILTNYSWDELQAQQSMAFATRSGFEAEKVYFGIDVFAQGGGRTTYPKDRGGGTNTGIAVAKLAGIGLSACLFAPAWSFEHFQNHRQVMDQLIWEGGALPTDIECPCKDVTKCHQPMSGSAIIKHAKSFPAGSDSFLFTDFTRPFSQRSAAELQVAADSTTLEANLGSQSILPLPRPVNNQGRNARLAHRTVYSPSGSKLMIEVHSHTSSGQPAGTIHDLWLPLYRVNVPANGTLQLAVTCNTPVPNSAELSLYLRFSDAREPQGLPIDSSKAVTDISATIARPSDAEVDARLRELGIHFRGLINGETAAVLEMFSISISPLQYQSYMQRYSIKNIRFESRGQAETAHSRLCWDYINEQEAMSNGVPYSEVTGPFSYFWVTMDDMNIAKAYALECVVKEDARKERAGKEVEVKVTGVGFDGHTLASATSTLRVPSDQALTMR